jgi:hypothetical protein
MTTTIDLDLSSELVDLTAISLDELWHLDAPALTDAIQHVYDVARFNTGNESQDQKG